MNKTGSDSFIWKNANDGIFSTRSMYNTLFKAIFVDNGDVAFTEMNKIWCKGVPIKVSSFLWKALRNRAPTTDNLVKRGIYLDDREKSCVFCSLHLEDVDHILCSCNFAYDIWRNCCGWVGVQSVGPNLLKSHFVQFISFGRGKVKKKLLNIIWQCTCWSIWKARNEALFQGVHPEVDSTVDRIKFRSWKWIRSFFPSFNVVPFHDWCSSPFLYSPSVLL